VHDEWQGSRSAVTLLTERMKLNLPRR